MTKKRLLAIGATTLAMTLALILAFNTQNALATFDWDVADGSILPTSYSADKNEWQLVSGEYNGNYDPFTADEDGTDTSVLTHKTVISDDGMVRVQKNVIPTDVENEFLVYMSMDAKTTQKVTQTDVTEYLGNLAYYENWSANSGGAYGDLGTPKGSIKEDGNRGHITIIMRYHGQIVGQGEVDAGVPNSYVYLEVGDNFITLGNFPNKASSVTFDVELTDRAYDALFETISSQTESTETVIGMDASSNAKVVDTMGEYIVYDGVEKKDSAATVTSGDNSITWNVVGKTDAEQSEHVTTQTTTQQGTDTVVTETVTYWWNYNIAELLYKVHLDVTKDGFENGKAYDVNENAVLTYTYGELQKTLTFQKPQVKGTLYEFEFKKVDEQGAALSGAEFTLTGPAVNPDVDSTSYTATSDADGKVKFTDLPWGEYTLSETTPPPGYTKSSETFTLDIGHTEWPDKVTHNDQAIDVYKYKDNWTVENKKNIVTVTKAIDTLGEIDPSEITHKIYVALQDRATGEYFKQNGEIVYKEITITNGQITQAEPFEGVPSGLYDVWEFSAPGTRLNIGDKVGTTIRINDIDADPNNNADLRTTNTAQVKFINTYSHAAVPINVAVTKKWTLSDGTTADAPEEGTTVSLTLFRTEKKSDGTTSDPEEVATLTLDGTADTDPETTSRYDIESEAWKALFANLPSVDETTGNSYTYFVKEVTCSDDDFIVEEGEFASGQSITNKRKTSEITVKKVVEGTDEDKAKEFSFKATLPEGVVFPAQAEGSTVSVDGHEAEFRLTNGGEVTITVPVNEQMTISEALSDSDKATYTTTASGITGGTYNDGAYAFSVPQNSGVVTFTNTHKKGVLRITKKVTGDKPYGLGNNRFNFTAEGPSFTEPETVTVGVSEQTMTGSRDVEQLYVGEYSVEEVASSAVFTGYDLVGTSYSPSTGKVNVTAANTVNNPAEIVVTNEYKQQTSDLTFTKIWDDQNNKYGKRFSVEGFKGAIDLFNGVDTAAVSSNPEITPNGNTWTITYKDMPDYVNGQEATYTLKEDPIEYYATEGSPASVNGTITNKINTVDITKTFTGISESQIPAGFQITPTFTVGEEEQEQAALVISGAVKTEGALTYTWTLPVPNNEVVVTAEETNAEITGYDLAATTPGSAQAGGSLAFVNAYTLSTIDIPVEKTWNDEDFENTAGYIRPEKITINLLAGNEVVKSKEVTANDGWSCSFEDLPEYDVSGEEAQKIVYAVEEAPLPEYTTEISKKTIDGVSGYEVINTPKTVKLDTATVFQKQVIADPANTGWAGTDGKTFNFSIVSGDGAPVPEEATANVTFTKAETKPIDFGDIVFTHAGTYEYTITEAAPGTGWSCDKTPYVVEVKVELQNGKLVIIAPTGKETIKNTYSVEPLNVTFAATKTLSGRTLENEQFSFSLSTKSGDNETVIETEKNDADGNVIFENVPAITTAGTYTYYIKEVNDGKGGYKYDSTEYKAVVTVTDGGSGALVAETKYYKGDTEITSDQVKFANEYHAKGTITINAKKILEDEFGHELQLKDGQFEFAIKDAEGTTLVTAKNKADGTITFPAVEFNETQVGTNILTVVETSGTTETEPAEEGGNTSDSAPGSRASAETPGTDMESKPEASDNNETDNSNAVEAKETAEEAQKEADEKAEAAEEAQKEADEKADAAEAAQKEADEKAEAAEEAAGDGNAETDEAGKDAAEAKAAAEEAKVVAEDAKAAAEEAKAEADKAEVAAEEAKAEANKAEVAAEAAKKEEQKIETAEETPAEASKSEVKEEPSRAADEETDADDEQDSTGINPDSRTYTVTVEVKDNGDGTLTCTSDDAKDIVFVNKYATNEVTVAISGRKNLEGRELNEGEFTFTISGNGPLPETTEVKNAADGSVDFGSIKFTREHMGSDMTKTFTYTISESGSAKGITFDSSKTVKVTVNDDGEGRLTYTTSPTSAPLFIFNNKYTPTPGKRSVTADVNVLKNLVGRDLVSGEFTFVLKDSKGNIVDKAVNDDSGAVYFKAITFPEEGDFTYSISELQGDAEGVTYDTNSYSVTAHVEDADPGEPMTVKWTYGDSNELTITNTYIAPPDEPDEPDEPDKPKRADTGDSNDLAGMLGLMASSAAGLAYMFFRRRREETL